MKNLFFVGITLAFIMSCSNEKSRELKGCKFEKRYAYTDSINEENFSKDLTIDTYIMLHSYPKKWTPIISKMKSDKEGEFCIRIKDENHGQFFFGAGEMPIVLQWKTTEVLPLNKWVRLTAVRDMYNRKLELYVNNKLVGTKKFKQSTEATITDNPIFIAGTGKQKLDITIADLRIWNKALTEKERIESSGKIVQPTKETHLIAYWLFDNIIDNQIKSLTNNRLDLQIK